MISEQSWLNKIDKILKYKVMFVLFLNLFSEF